MVEMQQDSLEKLQDAKRYLGWIHSLCRPHLGKRVLEIGSGIGNMTEFLLAEPAVRRVLATDLEPAFLKTLKSRWPRNARLATAVWDINRPAPAAVNAFKADTIVSINIIEHVEADEVLLRRLQALLSRGGKCLVFVPALPCLFGALDRELHHARRYLPQRLRRVLASAGFDVPVLHFFNFPGVLAWWLTSVVLRQEQITTRQVGWYDQWVPLFQFGERLCRPPLGQSLFAVGVKR